MKYFLFAFIMILCWGCDRPVHMQIAGEAAGVANGVVSIIKDGKVIFAQNLTNGKFKLNEYLPSNDYYTLQLSIDGGHIQNTFDIFIENTPNQIKFNTSDFWGYPQIKSESVIQNQLSDFYNTRQAATKVISDKLTKIKALINSKEAKGMSATAYGNQITLLQNTEDSFSDIPPNVLAAYCAKHPDNKIGAHLMATMDYEKNPRLFYSIFNTFTNAVKESAEGKAINKRLKQLLKMQPGMPAPEIVGNTPDGRVFSKTVSTKPILIEFWRAKNSVSRTNHQKILNDEIKSFKNGELAIISISLDTDKEWWLGAVKDDKLTWQQVSDLKGEDSPNLTNWGAEIPGYFLIDKNWRIIKGNLALFEVDSEMHDYLQQHKN